MNYYLAVFNCHIKDAEQAACEKFISIWREKKFNTIVEWLQKNGLISIINKKPKRYTKFFVYFVRSDALSKKSYEIIFGYQLAQDSTKDCYILYHQKLTINPHNFSFDPTHSSMDNKITKPIYYRINPK